MSKRFFGLILLLFLGSVNRLENARSSTPEISFDLPLITGAVPVSCDANGHRLVEVELRLSSMILSPKPKPIDQWVVRCQPRDESIMIADYAPRTEVASSIQGSIQIKTSDEKTSSAGISLDGNYTNLVRGHTGTDHGNKKSECQQYDRLAPVQAVTASGTINRGRGVYFKLKWTEQQVLEGEKVFHLTLSVPESWRTGLIDVSVIAQSERKSFGSWEAETETLGHAQFVVAVFGDGDQLAYQAATSLSRAEEALRIAAANAARKEHSSLPSFLKNVTQLFDPQERVRSDAWVQGILLATTNPHSDKDILRLPVQTRVVAIDYCEARDKFIQLSRHRSSSSEIAKNQEENLDKKQRDGKERYAASRHPIKEE